MKTEYQKDSEIIDGINRAESMKYGKVHRYTYEGHQNAVRQEAVKMVHRYEITGVLE